MYRALFSVLYSTLSKVLYCPYGSLLCLLHVLMNFTLRPGYCTLLSVLYCTTLSQLLNCTLYGSLSCILHVLLYFYTTSSVLFTIWCTLFVHYQKYSVAHTLQFCVLPKVLYSCPPYIVACGLHQTLASTSSASIQAPTSSVLASATTSSENALGLKGWRESYHQWIENQRRYKSVSSGPSPPPL